MVDESNFLLWNQKYRPRRSWEIPPQIWGGLRLSHWVKVAVVELQQAACKHTAVTQLSGHTHTHNSVVTHTHNSVGTHNWMMEHKQDWKCVKQTLLNAINTAKNAPRSRFYVNWKTTKATLQPNHNEIQLFYRLFTVDITSSTVEVSAKMNLKTLIVSFLTHSAVR